MQLTRLLYKKAVPWQGEPRDAAVHFDTYIYRQWNFTTASCGFPATAHLSCWRPL